MGPQAKSRMTVDEFLAWAETQPGRYELVNGEVVAMSPQTARHVRMKSRVHAVLARLVAAAGLDCEVFADGMTVRVDPNTAFEPDALIQCGERLADDALDATAPLLIVEVLLPGTKWVDTGRKLEGYFRVPSVVHYLIVDPDRPVVIHHRHGKAGLIETRIASSGTLDLSPPGLTLSVTDLFGEVTP